MQYLADYSIKHNRALVRVDYNVPLDKDQKILDTTKIDATTPTITKILQAGASITLMSHLGRPQNGFEEKLSLKPIAQYLEKITKKKVNLVNPKAPRHYDTNEIVLLENLRFYPGEEAADPNFARDLSLWGDFYVNDAFATAHRAHASTTTLPYLFKDKMAGLLIQKEVETANKILNNPKQPFVLIVGGSKVNDKIKPILALMPHINTLILGGAVANTFLKATGIDIGASLVQPDQIGSAIDILNAAKRYKVRVQLPSDVVVINTKDKENQWPEPVDIDDIPKAYAALDIGPETRDTYENTIKTAQTVLWSGPMGYIEADPFHIGTQSVASAVHQAVAKGALSLIGGGDTISGLSSSNIENIGHISTGGSALLQYIADRNLPGLLALE